MITVRQITWDFLKRVRGVKDSGGQVKTTRPFDKLRVTRKGFKDSRGQMRKKRNAKVQWRKSKIIGIEMLTREIHSRDISILNMYTSLYTLRGEI